MVILSTSICSAQNMCEARDVWFLSQDVKISYCIAPLFMTSGPGTDKKLLTLDDQTTLANRLRDISSQEEPNRVHLRLLLVLLGVQHHMPGSNNASGALGLPSTHPLTPPQPTNQPTDQPTTKKRKLQLTFQRVIRDSTRM